MKKINKITTALFLPLIMLFSSCFDPIFYEIRKDVEPESATVSGNISQITRYTMNGEEYLFLSANHGLRYKKAANQTHGSWRTMSLPFSLMSYDYDDTSMSDYQLAGVFADSDTLYLVAFPFTTDSSNSTTNPSSPKIWASKTPDNIESWDIIDMGSDITFSYSQDESTELHSSLFFFFQTNTPQKAHRHVYFRTSKAENEEPKYYKYFELNGKATPTEITNEVLKTKTETDDSGNKTTKYVNIEDGGSKANSAAYFGGIKFYSSKVVVTDETETADAEHVYFGDGTHLYYSTEDGYKSICDVSRTISALAVTADSILIGLGNIKSRTEPYGGIKRVLLTDGIPASATSSFDSNADFQITSAYKVLALLNATPDKTESESALYAAITCSYNSSGLDDNKGLWSYYPDRANWNRE